MKGLDYEHFKASVIRSFMVSVSHVGGYTLVRRLYISSSKVDAS
jgi:hypothetical protein